MSRSPATASEDGFIRHSLLEGIGVDHGFGTRQAEAPERMLRPEQVHGHAVARLRPGGEFDRMRADAAISNVPGTRVGIVTADCVPILAAAISGRGVVAIHAGWRGLAAGVVEAGVRELAAGLQEGDEILAVVGPHIGVCCYEVDRPVLDALSHRFGEDVESSAPRTRPGHVRLDLGRYVEAELEAAGIAPRAIGRLEDACTYCNPERFYSYRREGTAAGRLVHFAAAKGSQ